MDAMTRRRRYNEALNPATRLGGAYGLICARPAAAQELEQGLGMSRRAAASTMSSLHFLGLIEPSGERRRNARGRWTIVWKATVPRPGVPGGD